MTSLRSEWFEYVKKIRKKNSKKDKPCSHTEAMKIASQSWAAVKQKLEKKRKRDKKKQEKQKLVLKKTKFTNENTEKKEK